MKKYMMGIGIAGILFAFFLGIFLSELQSATAAPYIQALRTSSQVIVDGKGVDFEAYNINGNNYFKLRDIAMALDGSTKQFDVNWDASENKINILTGNVYTAVGRELSITGSAGNKSALLSTVKVSIDGKFVPITAYIINGNNYFKLRDLGENINFRISWDADQNKIIIDTAEANDEQLEKIFGGIAYHHVEYIQNNLSKRISGTSKEKATAQYILTELKKAGYDSNHLTSANFEFIKNQQTYYSKNIIATKEGTKDKVIVVGAHYDSVDTFGVDDNGSGVAVVLETADRLIGEQVPYTIKFIFFGAEEGSITGSSRYLKSLSEQERDNILLMINVDSILAGDKQYLFGGKYGADGILKDVWAAEAAKKIADQLGLEMYLNPYINSKYKSPNDRSDHINFRYKDIPYVFFWAGNVDLFDEVELCQTKDLGKIMHTTSDNLIVINKSFEGRAKERLANYSELLYHMLKEIQ